MEMAKRKQDDLVKEIEKNYSQFVSQDAKHTILTIRNLIESNARVEDSIDELHKSINNSNIQNEKLQKRIFYLTIVGVILAFVQVVGIVLRFK